MTSPLSGAAETCIFIRIIEEAKRYKNADMYFAIISPRFPGNEPKQ
jgi:hypothetical protein